MNAELELIRDFFSDPQDLRFNDDKQQQIYQILVSNEDPVIEQYIWGHLCALKYVYVGNVYTHILYPFLIERIMPISEKVMNSICDKLDLRWFVYEKEPNRFMGVVGSKEIEGNTFDTQITISVSSHIPRIYAKLDYVWVDKSIYRVKHIHINFEDNDIPSFYDSFRDNLAALFMKKELMDFFNPKVFLERDY